MTEMQKKIEAITSREEFVEFIKFLISTYGATKWENSNLISYLDAMANWTEDMDGYYANQNIELPQNIDWKIFANILVGATVYE